MRHSTFTSMLSTAVAVTALTIALTLSLSPLAHAKMSLQLKDSQVNFISIKNEHIAETHSFDSFTGSLSESGALKIKIDLTSVNTLIPIRNERMQSMLFNVSEYTSATFTADLDQALLDMKSGTQQRVSITGDLMISGKSVPTTFDVNVTKLADGSMQAATVKPTILNATSFDLVGGLKALQEVAMLKSISNTVPLSFSVVFK